MSSETVENNPLIKNINTELQYNEHKQWTPTTYIHKEEWIGSTARINEKFKELVPEISEYSWSSDGESYTIDRLKGDLSKLTHSYQESYELKDSEGNNIDDPIDESMGITPWTVTTETTDIGAVEYYILKNGLSEADQNKIKRERLALWENAPIEYKNLFKYKTLTKGWVSVSQNESGAEDSPETLAVAEWITQNGRSTFPLTTLRVTHEEIVKGPSFKKGKINKNSLKKDVAAITFPSDEISKEIDVIPDCPYDLTTNSYPTKFMLTDWNAQVHDEEGKYLITKTYVSYPEAFPLPIDATPTNEQGNNI